MPSAAASCRLPFPGGRDGDDCGFLVISGATFEWILLLLAFYSVGGGDDVDSAEDSWSRSVLCSSLGIELLCSPWGGFFIRVGGFLFRLGRSVALFGLPGVPGALLGSCCVAFGKADKLARRVWSAIANFLRLSYVWCQLLHLAKRCRWWLLPV